MDAELLRHQRFLQRVVRTLTRNGAEADDLEQATWLAALERRQRAEAPRAWLALVARNLFRNSRRTAASEVRAHEDTLDPRAWPPADEVAAELERAERVLAAVRALPETLRSAVHARYYEGLAVADIARLSGVSNETIQERLERARELLRRRLARERREELLGALLIGLARFRSSIGGAWLVKNLAWGVVAVLVVVFAWRMHTERSRDLTTSASEQSAALTIVPESPLATPPTAERTPESPVVLAERAAPPPDAAGSMLVSVTWPDGTPAEHVLVRVATESEGDLARFPRTAQTNGDGKARFAALEAGRYHVQLERERSATTSTVESAAETRVALAVSAGPRVEGLVVDDLGAPVPGAGVWISTRYASWNDRPLDGSFAAFAGPDGRFVIPSAGAAWLIGALAEGYAPSKEKSLTRFSLSVVEVRLVLPGRGGAIEGRVVSASGAPLEGAMIAADIGLRFDHYQPENGSMRILNSLRVRTSSAPDGTFRFLGVQPGSVELQVLALGHQSWSQEVVVNANATTHVEAQVAAGGSVRGHVRTLDGTPLGGMLVAASTVGRPAPADLTANWLDQDWNAIVRSSWDCFATARTGADGAFHLDGLTPGHSFLLAQTAGGDRAAVPLWIESEVASEQDLVLTRGLELVCWLVLLRGASL
jgi:RNA polymerase sigma-70 factor (ECF subfamily)